jgi:glycerophosphoryl diester phosphodiesterase
VDRSEGDERWLISSFRRETIDRCRALRPTIATAWLTVGVREEDRAACIASLSASGHSAIHPWFGHVTEEMIGDFHAAGLKVNTWTCDDPARMQELIDWGIDGICTNIPDVALAVVARTSGGEE